MAGGVVLCEIEVPPTSGVGNGHFDDRTIGDVIQLDVPPEISNISLERFKRVDVTFGAHSVSGNQGVQAHVRTDVVDNIAGLEASGKSPLVFEFPVT